MSKLPYFSNGFNDSSKDKWLKPLSKLPSRYEKPSFTFETFEIL